MLANTANSYLDLSGLFFIQQNHLFDISGQNHLNQDLTKKVSDIQNKLETSYHSFQQANATTANILDHQNEMSKIITTEKQRLDLKKKTVDDALYSQQRMIDLNNSFRERYTDYTKILVIFVITLVAFLGIMILQKNLTIIPSILFTILSILVLVVGLFTVYFKYSDTTVRDKLNYSQLDLAPPDLPTPAQVTAEQAKNAAAGNLLGTINIGGCVGPQCCSGNTIWDTVNSVCMIGNTVATGNCKISTFITLDKAYTTGEYRALPNSPNEFEKYSKI